MIDRHSSGVQKIEGGRGKGSDYALLLRLRQGGKGARRRDRILGAIVRSVREWVARSR